MLQSQQFTTSDSSIHTQQRYNESYETKTIMGMMILLVAISTLMIACCVSNRRKKEKRSSPDAVIATSYRPFGQPTGYGTRMKPNISVDGNSAYRGGGGAAGGRIESRPLRNLSAESDVSRSMVGSRTNSISDDIFVSQSSNHSN